MELITIESSVYYLDVDYKDGNVVSIRKSLIKEVRYDETRDAIVLIIKNDTSREFAYNEVENPDTGEAFDSLLLFLEFLGLVLNMSVGSIYDIYSQYLRFNYPMKVLDGKYYTIDLTSNKSDLQIKNTQVAKFDSLAYISGNFTGYTISSYEGLASPTKTNDSRIDVTAGLIYSITITNGALILTWYATEEQGTELYFKDGLGNILVATLNSATLSDFWSETSEYAYPALLAKGGSKYLVNEVTGTTVTLANPDGSNLGAEKVIDGDFPDGSIAWDIVAGESQINNGSLRIYSSDGSVSQVQQDNILTIGKCYKYELDIIESNSGTLQVQEINGGYIIADTSKVGHYEAYFIATSTGIRFKRAIGITDIRVDNASVKEVTAIPAYGAWGGSFKKALNGILEIDFISDGIDVTTNNGYGLFVYNDGTIYFSRITNGSGIILFNTIGNYINPSVNYQWRVKRNQYDNQYFESPANWIQVEIRGGDFTDWTIVGTTGGSGTNPIFDDTYTETKFLVLDNDAGDEVNNLSYNGLNFDVDDFIDGTGTYGVQKVIAISPTLDAKGNELEYLPNKGLWNTGNTYCQPSGNVGLFTLSQTYGLGWYGADKDSPLEVNWDTLKSYDTNSIPKNRLDIDNEGDYISYMNSNYIGL